MEIRIGQCNRCGYCCGLAQEFQTKEQKQYMIPCVHLLNLEDGTTECLVFGQKGVCDFDFPITFQDLADGSGWTPPTCGYSFVEVDE